MTEELERADNDSPWKEILEAYFPQAMHFFFPETAILIDWERPHEFLDKEFQQIARDAEQGRRYADKLVKVWQIQGEEIWLLIHVEIQARPEENFAQRMFSYNLRIFDKFGKPAISLAILCDAEPNWRPNQYNYNYPNTRLNFEFGTVKLLDYQNRWAELEKSDNPFATVVMAHLKTQQTSKKPGDRKTWKFSLIRRLYEQGLQEKDIRNLYQFIDWVMILPKALEAEFWEEFKQFEQERTMSYVTTGERIGYERGQQEQAQSLVLRQVKKRVGELPPEIQERIQSLSLGQLEALGEALLDFTGLEDLLSWLEANPAE
ncbi:MULTISPECIES: DUF4351 domain-containing protein [unclassified Tolypothrix]|uniref:DUF4351 domain-containing protein n=1 Tax=unclassified Tolypothrix TaxID=2649714 RepID=UPI0005EAB28A|nr:MULTISPECIES: DUF4351 domain-containing protein [unclassified Tolypothrix]BAY88885.1 hypothetical protein NIES3275_08850 [Microchaete diplosiphon NIES-3275]EKF03208.1 hypothetical protein FDUTEX481_05489 [Tolypothrix sp. PCC 7601]MBE9086515.1 DUF4351 domain-containing protein [Tolypothrix sp. LEGE 11397]UYD29528.1 DUF4351 domain-containing protein [Tolypothrix sp. PCC 7712]UYD34560.1 DUF4351 domain-containing protein [Tolypothrix sp. PCC 7601]